MPADVISLAEARERRSEHASGVHRVSDRMPAVLHGEPGAVALIAHGVELWFSIEQAEELLEAFPRVLAAAKGQP